MRWAFTGALLFAATSGRAAEAPAAPDRSLRAYVAGGYGFSVRLSRGRADEHMLLFQPGLALPLSRRLELIVEGHFAGFFSPGGYMVGLMPVGGRFFFGGGRMQPYVSLGAGFGWTDLEELEELDRRFNYLLQGSLGIRRRLADGNAWTLEGRFSHVSNAATVLPNLGLNSVVLMGGWRFD